VANRWVGAALVIAALLALGLQTGVVARAGFIVGDFRAFYCAARVASHGANPYDAQPLHDCEAAVGAARFFAKNPGVTIPAPLPGYVIGALVPLSLLPFGVAAGVWVTLLLLAWVAGVIALSRVAGVGREISFAVFALSLGAISLPFGEVVPFSVAFICMAAAFARKGSWRAAALCAAGAMVEPHLGLPAAAALAAWAPRSRATLVVLFAAMGAISLLVLGPAINVEYFTSVLPSHALSEATRDTQYSLTAVLAAAGVPAAAAAKAGALWYLALLALGIFVGGRLAQRTANDAFVVCVPPAFAVFGGTFIHITQIAVALPAAVLLVPYCRREYSALAVMALLVLAVPWGWANSPALIIAPLVPVAYLAWHYWSAQLSAVLLAGIAAALLIIGFERLFALGGPHIGVVPAAPSIDTQLAEAGWSEFSRASSNGTIAAWAVRIPTWAGLLVVLTLLTTAASPAGVILSRPRSGRVEGQCAPTS